MELTIKESCWSFPLPSPPAAFSSLVGKIKTMRSVTDPRATLHLQCLFWVENPPLRLPFHLEHVINKPSALGLLKPLRVHREEKATGINLLHICPCLRPSRSLKYPPHLQTKVLGFIQGNSAPPLMTEPSLLFLNPKFRFLTHVSFCSLKLGWVTVSQKLIYCGLVE